MRNLSTNEMQQVAGGNLLTLVTVPSGALLGAAIASQIGPVNLALIGAVSVLPITIAGAIVGAAVGLAISGPHSDPYGYYYY